MRLSFIKETIITFVLLNSVLQAQSLDTNVFKYYPILVGNRWTWQIEANVSPGPGYKSLKVQGIQNFGGKFYFQCLIDYYYFIGNQHINYTNYYRVDSTTGNLYLYYLNTQKECLVDSLNSQNGDSSAIGCYPDQKIVCDTGSVLTLGQIIHAKRFGWGSIDAAIHRIYAVNYGDVYEETLAMTSYSVLILQGCVLNGNIYGDTAIILGVNQISTALPKSFYLFQNYPNPFNPNTKIKFQIAKLGNVKLKIYDALGREIITLVDEPLQPGTYEVDWNGTNYASGIYYYRMQSGNFVDFKKMILLK
jgi:hypothetical protein